ncbi:MAG: LysR substrate-binding domain-containing protein [Comamonas sp.]
MNTPLPPRTRPLQVGHLRAFEAVAHHLNFRAAAEALSLTQSAVSRQIQALEDEVGVPLFYRHTRAVELSSAGGQLLQALTPSLQRIDAAVRLIRQNAGRRSVALSTWASFASMWVIPRLEAFQHAHPDIDIRIDATDITIDLETADVDLALRYARAGHVPPRAIRLFGEQLTPVASPWLLKSGPPVVQPQDLRHFPLIEAGDAHRTLHLEWLTWRRWFAQQSHPHVEAKRWLYFNYAHQIVQAAVAGQGIALARLPLVADALARGDLVEVLPGRRMDSPMGYWLLMGPRSAARPEVQAFKTWLLEEARVSRQVTGEVPDPDTEDHLD